MKINCTKPQYNTNFKAIKVATIKNLVMERAPDIEIYQLRLEDYGFLQKLNSVIDYKKLCPKLAKSLQERWDNVFHYCIFKAFSFGNLTYLAVKNNIPCGILTYNENKGIYLDGICSIPNKKGEKTHLAGKALFYQLFKDAESKHVKDIRLDAITDGPFDVIKKYENLGFKNIGYKVSENKTLYAEMVCNKEKIKKQLKQLPTEIAYEETFERRNLIDFIKL